MEINKRKILLHYFGLLLLNLVFFIIIMKQGNIVYQDSAAGFFDFFFKKIIQLSAIIIIVCLPTQLGKDLLSNKFKINGLSWFMMIWLGIWAFLWLMAACDDDLGYCQQFTFRLPENSFPK